MEYCFAIIFRLMLLINSILWTQNVQSDSPITRQCWSQCLRKTHRSSITTTPTDVSSNCCYLFLWHYLLASRRPPPRSTLLKYLVPFIGTYAALYNRPFIRKHFSE